MANNFIETLFIASALPPHARRRDIVLCTNFYGERVRTRKAKLVFEADLVVRAQVWGGSSTAEIEDALKKRLGVKEISKGRGTGGGCINETSVYETDQGPFFVKVNRGIDRKMFDGEFLGLQAMHKTKTVRVPEPYCVGSLGNGGSFFIMEYLPFGGGGGNNAQIELGYQMAALHLAPPVSMESHGSPEGKFGFWVDNTIGSTPQPNGWMDDWVEFYRDRRLGFQLRLAGRKFGDSALKEKGDKLLKRLPELFEGIEVQPSLLHGDLWAGNYASGLKGEPIIFDPATYYGHHEAELSIMKMFGGFSGDFFKAYHERIPRAPGFEERQQLYQLYHYLNHLNLFGGSYLGSCMSILNQLT